MAVVSYIIIGSLTCRRLSGEAELDDTSCAQARKGGQLDAIPVALLVECLQEGGQLVSEAGVGAVAGAAQQVPVPEAGGALGDVHEVAEDALESVPLRLCHHPAVEADDDSRDDGREVRRR
jgi:hypothetical protein